MSQEICYSTKHNCTDIVNEAWDNELVASKDVTKRYDCYLLK